MTEKILIAILVIHFLADFGLQTHEQATNKSTSNKFLFYHVGVYSLIWLLITPIFFDSLLDCFLFSLITFWAHFTTDYVTSRIGKPFWGKNNFHDGFVVIGFDQMLHYIQLYLTFKLFL